MRKFLMFFIRIYQIGISPFFAPRCRFYPTCSHYAMEALSKYGTIKGSWIAVKRLSKCHPYNPGGYDPVN